MKLSPAKERLLEISSRFVPDDETQVDCFVRAMTDYKSVAESAAHELDDCALLLRRLVRKVRAGHINAAVSLCDKIDDYLKRKGLAVGSPLRFSQPNAEVKPT